MTLFGKKTPKLRVSVFGKTDVGRTREHNEDCFLVADLTAQNASLQPEVREHELGPKGSLLLVADGMGGAAAGEVASEMAVETIFQYLKTTWIADDDDSPQQFATRLKEAVETANTKIHQYATSNSEMRGMGTTITAVGVLEDHLYLTQVGDSRAYLIREGVGTQLTKDQSLMQRLVDAGEITEEEAERSERRNIILQALGPDPQVRVDLTHQQLRRGDAVVLCSDGLSGQVTREEIAQIAAQESKGLVEACGELIDLANERGGPDNITVLIARFAGDSLRTADSAEDVGHQVFPLLDTDSTTEQVPVYRGAPPPLPESTAQMIAAAAIAGGLIAAALFVASGGL